MIEIEKKYQSILLEALEDMLYKLSLQLEDLKGQPLDTERKELSRKQELVEELQRVVLNV